MVLSTACISGITHIVNGKKIYVAPGETLENLPEDIIADLVASGLAIDETKTLDETEVSEATKAEVE